MQSSAMICVANAWINVAHCNVIIFGSIVRIVKLVMELVHQWGSAYVSMASRLKNSPKFYIQIEAP